VPNKKARASISIAQLGHFSADDRSKIIAGNELKKYYRPHTRPTETAIGNHTLL
jgi:hypothetical protein